MTSRRAFLFAAAPTLAAPAVVRAESLMKIAALRDSTVNFNAAMLERLIVDSEVWQWRELKVTYIMSCEAIRASGLVQS